MKRVESEELLDHDVPAEDRARSLTDLRRINRYAGGRRAYRLLIQKLIRGGAFSILDLGTGSSDLLESLKDGSRIGLDLKIEHLLYARDSRIRRITADAFRLPLAADSVDVVGSSHFFHHFSPEENVAILRESLRVARVGVFVTDTERHLVALLAIQALGVARVVGRVTRHDGPASVRQGYTRSELKDVASRIPARKFSVMKIFPFRLGLVLWK